MEIDLSQPGGRIESGAVLRAEVCIVGAGIAGLTLAHKLAGQGISIILVEAGGHTPEKDLSVDLTGQPYAAATQDRIRAFGGTSLLWGGQILPLQAVTLASEQRPDGWPIAASDLAAYIAEAEKLLAVDALPYQAPDFFTATRQPTPPLLSHLPHLDARLSKFAPFSHRNLAQTLGRALRFHPRVHVLLHAPVSELLLSSARDGVEAALVATPERRSLRIEAAQFVVAAGTIETVRLLLASSSISPEGIGNTQGQLGRNLHDHLTFSAATLHGPARNRLLREFRPWVFGRTVHSLKLEATTRLRADLGLNPALAHLTMEEPIHSGIANLRNMLRARQQRDSAPPFAAPLQTLPRAAMDALRLTLAAKFQHRRYVSPQATVRLQINSGQAIPSRSRITLSEKRDALGVRLPAIDWDIAIEDLKSISRFASYLRQHMDSVGLPGFTWLPALSSPDVVALHPHLDDARHPMGGAIMSADPRTSVVDPCLAVHGIRNLSVASAAVFPDGSPQLPTLTLMALTLRLADRLHTNVGRD